MSAKRPNVIFSNSDIVVGSISENKGIFGGTWVIRFGPRNQPTQQSMTINPNTSGGTAGGGFKVVWS
jgi:hypothetical protein